MYTTKNSFSVIMKQIFPVRNYNGPNIRSQIDFALPKGKTLRL